MIIITFDFMFTYLKKIGQILYRIWFYISHSYSSLLPPNDGIPNFFGWLGIFGRILFYTGWGVFLKFQGNNRWNGAKAIC